jgi:hypothetical protein
VDLVFVIHLETLGVVLVVLGLFLVAQLVQGSNFGVQVQVLDLLVVADLVRLAVQEHMHL